MLDGAVRPYNMGIFSWKMEGKTSNPEVIDLRQQNRRFLGLGWFSIAKNAKAGLGARPSG